MRSRIGQGFNDLQLLDDRAGPSVRDDERQRILMWRTSVDKMNIQAVDLGDELWHPVEPRLHFAPVVFRGPIAGEFAHRRKLNTLRRVGHRFSVRPLCRSDALAEIDNLLFRNVDAEGSDWTVFSFRLELG